MKLAYPLIAALALSLAACGNTGPAPLGPDGKPLPRVHRISDREANKITYRFLDGLNELRSAAAVGPVQLNAKLTSAAATHSQDMSRQNRPWHFGSDGSSPIDRVARSGYTGQMLGENISETFETELETLAAWMGEDDTKNVLLDPRARDIGFAWFQDNTGKLWWTLVTGSGDGAAPAS